MRARHPKKDVEQALQYAEDHGWTVEPTQRGHRWGRLKCPKHECSTSIWSTPKNPGNFANQIRRAVARCVHSPES